MTTAQMAFMTRYSSGLICAPLSPSIADALDLPPMVAAAPTVTTGISSHDRALTCRVLAAEKPNPQALRRPGHVFPLRAKEGGIRVRRGHTEAATEFCKLSGKSQSAVLCEIVDNGEEVPGQAIRSGSGMLRGVRCIEFARKWGLKVCTIADLIDYVEKTEGKLITNGSD
jgi:3,4-dihydroxy 2-butanone 4-phosphate synthase